MVCEWWWWTNHKCKCSISFILIPGEGAWPFSTMPKAKQKHSDIDSNAYCIIHAACLADHGRFTPLKSIKSDPHDKLSFLCEIRNRRLAEPLDSPYRCEDSCNLLPQSLSDITPDTNVGYHRECYSRFTRNLDRLRQPPHHVTSPTHEPVKYSPRKRTSTGEVVFPPTCIFCEKVERWVVSKKATERTHEFTHWTHKDSGWMNIAPWAEELGDTQLFRLVNNVDLHARSAKYHPSCYRDFVGRYSNLKRTNAKVDGSGVPTSADVTHAKAYTSVKDYLELAVVNQNEVVTLPSVRDLYIKELERNGSPNPNYRGNKLLARLQDDPQVLERLAFSKVSPGNKGCLSFWLIYRADITIADAMARVYKLASGDNLKDVAQQLRSVILRAYKEEKDMPWPPTVHDIPEPGLPHDLQRFLSFIFDGHGELQETCEKTRRLILSIGQDICRAATAGQWKLPKHILLCTTIRHLYRGRQLTTILNRLGHCEGYDFGIELETALVGNRCS